MVKIDFPKIKELTGLGKTLLSNITGNGEELQTPDPDKWFDYYHYLRVIRRPTSIYEIRKERKFSIPIRNGNQIRCSANIISEEEGEFYLKLEFENEDSKEEIQISPDFTVSRELGGKDISFTYTYTKEKEEKIYKHYLRIVETSERTEKIYKLKMEDELKIEICHTYRVRQDLEHLHPDVYPGQAEIKKNDKDGFYLCFNGQDYKCDEKQHWKENVDIIYTNIKVVK